MLRILETLKYFRTTLLGNFITVYKDHEKITYENFTTKRVIHYWRLPLEEYRPDITYIKVYDNETADALIRLPLLNSDVKNIKTRGDTYRKAIVSKN